MTEPNLEPTNNIDDQNISADLSSDNLTENQIESSVESETSLPQDTASESQNNEEVPEEKMTTVTENPEPVEPTVEITEELTIEPAAEPVAETIAEPQVLEEVLGAVEEIEEIEEIHPVTHFDGDYTNYSKKEFVDLADKMLDAMKARNLSSSDVKNIDNVLKVVKGAFDELHAQEKQELKKAYIAENGSQEGFEYKNDNYAIRFESILIQIRDQRHAFYQKLEREREDYFEIKTRLLQQLREIVEIEEKGESKNNWEAFKKLQSDWKNAGNINSPHNGSLWSAYNALVDRYFDIRSIQNELKDLDRKKNTINKEAVVIKIEALSETIKDAPLTNVQLKKANDLLAEYKHIGPGNREEQDALWARLKAAFDVIYEKKRELSKETQVLLEDTLNAKNQILSNLKPYLEFQSESINEWNAKSKEVMEIQEQWNAIKGPLPRDKGRDISKEFWHDLKHFFKNKSEFFARLEAKREANYKAKNDLCAAAEEILASGDHSAPNTNKIIDLQKKWKTIGHVPEKYKDTLYNKFKAACDQYFDLKRNENKVQDAEFEKNLADKLAICEKIEKLAATGDTNLGQLAEFKKEFNAVGFVPRKDMQEIQARFIKAINSFVKTSSGIDKSEKDKLMLQNEAEVVLKTGGVSSRNLEKQEGEIKRKIKALEEEISLTRNNLEFFGYSKNAEKLKEEYLKKVVKAENELKELNDKLKLISAAV